MIDEYKVEWAIDAFDMEGPIAAAEYAQQMQQLNREGYFAGVFIVTDSEGRRFKVDLDDPQPEAERLTDMTKTYDVYNHSENKMESGTLATCPRCSGFGAVFGDADKSPNGRCTICHGDETVILSETGWLRRRYSPKDKSELY